MKPNLVLRLLRHSLPVLIAAFVITGLANAQTVVGSFTLPYEAKWVMATLPAGTYQFTLEGRDSRFFVQNGTKGVALVLAFPSHITRVSNDSSLIVVRRGNRAVIQAVKLGCIGTVYDYSVPKDMKPALIAQERGFVRVPITASLVSSHWCWRLAEKNCIRC